ncbi:hypothetical protein C8035_v003276 [Colletotrichum spinosum]|uniref:Uncharacterized protein n=1 Tax=Colletotrichum spinosum TaxID=1347390 RepID=A0A4R8QS70_9PEZI|nr:hypothetical protein C8035_v003276 [Colletotrichum spinosum]
MSKDLPRYERRSSSPPAPGGNPFGQCDLSVKTILGFLSTRALRGGPRLVIQVVLALFGLVLLGKFLTSPTRDLADAGSRWTWSPFASTPQEEFLGNGKPGGVRIVAFGSPDIATPSNGKGKGWTEMLCEELSCSTFHSLIPSPNLPNQALTSHEHYNATLDKVTRELAQQKAPGYDYDFLLSQFPLAADIADVTAQVDAFLASPLPRPLPKETVWVFSFGTWDVWTLAALPRDLGQGIVDLAVRRLFAQVERVYQASLATESAAFSDFWAYQSAAATAALLAKLNAPGTPSSSSSPPPSVDARELENFRLVVPKLLDVSLTPGWHARRPAPPAPHTKAEQMTNAAHLTARWNSEVDARLQEWMRTPDPQQSEGSDDDEGKDDGKFGAVASRRASPVLRRGVAASATAAPRGGDVDTLRVPFPRRVGAQVDTEEFVRRAIIERQMRRHGLSDVLGYGNGTEADGVLAFEEVWTPCIWAKTGETPEVAGGYPACDVPDGYLFHSPFTLGERAIRETARIAAAEARSKLAFVDAVDDEGRGEEEEEQGTPAARAKRSESGFQRVLRPSRLARMVDAACPTLDVC